MPGTSPGTWSKRTATTNFLRVPSVDWAAVSTGYKTEFRMLGQFPWAASIKTPTPVVAYTSSPGFAAAKLMVLEETFTMPLGMISDESLAREGFPDLSHFRRYWKRRTSKRFALMDTVQAFRVRLATADDYDAMGRMLLAHLYGEHL